MTNMKAINELLDNATGYDDLEKAREMIMKALKTETDRKVRSELNRCLAYINEG